MDQRPISSIHYERDVIRMIMVQTHLSSDSIQQALNEHHGDVTETVMSLLESVIDEP